MSNAGCEIAYCHACGTAMDITAVAPFSNVTCPKCGKHTRVKREFGQYTLLRTHAIGGMSVVFVAQDDTLDREVALKILSESFSADEKRIAAFEEEARLTASISHPHVVRLFTTGRAFGHYYLAMEFVPGGHLEGKIRDSGSLPEREVLRLALQIADGLRAAHAAGLIHRDIKPGNILFDEQGNAKIVDFGLALVTHGGSAKAEEIWATPYYVPPEAIDGRTEDFRSDMYAFGATLYHALAGKPPCGEESMSGTLLRQAKQRVVPLAQAAPWVGAETCAAVDRAMAFDPGARFQSYEELIAALQSALRHIPAGAGSQTVGAGRGSQPPRRGRIAEQIGLTAGGMAVLAALGFGVWWVVRDDEQPAAAAGGNASTGPVAAGSGQTAVDHEALVRVGRIYRGAQKALAEGDYETAEKRFVGLLGDPVAAEPTATIAGIESAVAALLDGRPGDARKRAGAVVKHLEVLGEGAEPALRMLGEAAERVRKLPPVEPDESVAREPAEVLRALLFALKNWEQGCFEPAAAWFKKVVESTADDEWGAAYRQLAARYLADHAIVLENDFEAPPADVTGCEVLKAKIEAAVGGLGTKGRALFALRNRQLELDRQVRRLKAAPPPPPPAPPPPVVADPLARIKELLAGAQFAAAAEALAALELDDPSDAAKRDAWHYLTTSAAGFLDGLAAALADGHQGAVLTSRDGSARYDRIAGTAEGGLLLGQGGAEPVAVQWGMLASEGLIDLHQALVRNEPDPAAQQRRHEQAIAFGYLTGDRALATAAAERLAAANPGFKERWNAAMKGLGE